METYTLAEWEGLAKWIGLERPYTALTREILAGRVQVYMTNYLPHPAASGPAVVPGPLWAEPGAAR